MNEARRVYEGHFIIRDSLIASVSGDEVQSEPARANLLTLGFKMPVFFNSLKCDRIASKREQK